MNTPQKIFITFLASVLFAPKVCGQGLYWEQKTTMSMMGEEHETQTQGYVKPLKLKTVSDEEGGGVIIRSDKEIIYSLNGKEKKYSEMTFKEFEGQMAQMSEKMKQMQEQLKQMPPEQRKMMEGMMGGMMQEKEYTLKKTGVRKKISGYSCQKVLMVEGDKEVGEFWITKDIGSMKEYAKDWSKLMDKLVKGPFAKIHRKLAELDGFAMESKFDGIRTVTTKLEKRSISDSEFEPPAGYTKVEAEKIGED